MAARVKAPTLIVWGMQDRGKPPGELDELQRLMPDARVVRVGNAAHYVHEEQPAAVAEAMIAMAAEWL